MRPALLVLLAACAAPQRPPLRRADEVQIQQVQVGWMQPPSRLVALQERRPDLLLAGLRLGPLRLLVVHLVDTPSGT